MLPVPFSGHPASNIRNMNESRKIIRCLAKINIFVLKHNILFPIKTKSQHSERGKKGALREKMEVPSSWSTWVSYLHRPVSNRQLLPSKKRKHETR